MSIRSLYGTCDCGSCDNCSETDPKSCKAVSPCFKCGNPPRLDKWPNQPLWALGCCAHSSYAYSLKKTICLWNKLMRMYGYVKADKTIESAEFN